MARKSLAASKATATPSRDVEPVMSPPRTRSRARKTTASPQRSGASRSPAARKMGSSASPARSPSRSPSMKRSSSPLSMLKAPSFSPVSATKKVTGNLNIVQIYYYLYLTAMLCAYLYLAYQVKRKFFMDNFMKLFTSPRPFAMLCEEAFYKNMLVSLKGYFDLIGLHFIMVNAAGGALMGLHKFFNVSFRGHVYAAADTWRRVFFAGLLYLVFVMYPVRSVTTHPLVAILMVGVLSERIYTFGYHLLRQLSPSCASNKFVRYLRFKGYYVHSPMVALSILIIAYEYITSHPSMTMIMKALAVLFTVYYMKKFMLLHEKYVKEAQQARV